MTPRSLRIAALLFGSGACALLYQIAWLREFRLVFGASTAASAAVLAIFIGGLGVGSRILGPVADSRRRPLLFYASLEGLIAASAAVTPLLLLLVREAYVVLGGSNSLGDVGGTLVRLALSALVLLVPTVAMGGTLPAAAREAESEGDAPRRAVALLYGANTLGAVCGSFVGTFFLVEALGNRGTLWMAATLNIVVAILAGQMALRLPATRDAAEPDSAAPEPETTEVPEAPPAFVLLAAAMVGFAFFLMELVWYRMLGPLLGGSVFTFGLILTLALLGIGLGGAAYSVLSPGRPPTLRAFGLTCLIEAACVALPLALGDSLALVALLLRPFGGLGFWGHVAAWTTVASVVVLPAALLAGYQFPLLIALLGRGRRSVGRHVGLAYAWNTAGAITGSIAGGFGLLPLLSAPGTWRLVALVLVALGAAALVLDAGPLRKRLVPAIAGGLALALAASAGPTAAWRHSGIGAGRASAASLTSANGVEDWLRRERAAIRWEREGVESSVALRTQLGVAFVINGKVDGHATLDAPTQVMSGLLVAALHPEARKALVIGLGTGSTGGWLGVVPGMERVDVVELEPAIVDIAEALAEVNHDVVRNPRVRIQIGDAREVLLASPERYDLVFSEPSNPYRAGIASLFTREYYQAVSQRLEPGGLFLQWVQGYEVDTTTVRTVLTTLRTVFPSIQAWRTHRDLFLLASHEPLVPDTEVLRPRLAAFPFDVALRSAWRVADLEGFLAHFVAAPPLLEDLARREPRHLNTDDRNRVEFGFARSVGRGGSFQLSALRRLAAATGHDRLELWNDDVNWRRVEELRWRLYGEPPPTAGDQETLHAAARAHAVAHHAAGRLAQALEAWRSQPRAPLDPPEVALVAEALAEAADPEALAALDDLEAIQPTEAAAVRARWLWHRGLHDEALVALRTAFERHRADPWPSPATMLRALDTARGLAATDPARARAVFEMLEEPFAALAIDDARVIRALEIATLLGPEVCRRALAPLEPWAPWREDILAYRAQCYATTADPRAAEAVADLRRFQSRQAPELGEPR